MNRIKNIIWLILTVMLFQACMNEFVSERPYPRVQTLDVTNISDSGAMFNACLSNPESFMIKEYGFVWSETKEPTIEYSEKTSTIEDIHTNSFSKAISSNLRKNLKYFLRAFVQTDQYLVYGEEKTFISLGSEAPKIYSFTPHIGIWGDTITILGKNFRSKEYANNAYLGELEAKIISKSDSVLKIIIPEVVNKRVVPIKVALAGNAAISTDSFTYWTPTIEKMVPENGTYDDTLTIYGNFLTNDKPLLTISLGGISPKIVSKSNSVIRLIVPQYLAEKSNILNFKTMGYNVPFTVPFRLNPPVIYSIEPETMTRYDGTITISGKNFNPIKNYNVVRIGDYEANINEVGPNYLKVSFPSSNIPYYGISIKKEVGVNVTTAHQQYTSPTNLKIDWQSYWTRKSDFPGVPRHYAIGFSLNGKGYYGVGFAMDRTSGLRDFW